MAGTQNGTDDSRWSNWYVLTTSNPRHLEDLLAKANEDCPGLFDSFCPYTSLPEEPGRGGGCQLSLRAALRRYDFVRIDKTFGEQRLVATVMGWNHVSTSSILFLRNSNRVPAQVSNHQLDTMRASCDAELIKPSSVNMSDLKVGQEICLANTPFAADSGEKHKCIIQSITRKKGGRIELRVEMTLFNVKFSNLHVTYEDPGAAGKTSYLLYDAQQKLLAIFRRKINNKETVASRRKDEQALQQIFANRGISQPEGAMGRHYMALMLICARLLGDAQGISQYVGLVGAELNDLSRIRESKAATDSRAWLHIAMFIATGQPHYRDLAKTYIRQYNPKSTYLQQFVKQSCKKAGERWIGLKKKRKTED